MKYSTEKALEEIMRRSRQIEVRRERRSVRIYSLASLLLIGALAVIISGMAGGPVPAGGQAVMGSFLLPAQAGGYVLTAVIAFTLGVILTIKTKKFRNTAGMMVPRESDKEDSFKADQKALERGQ